MPGVTPDEGEIVILTMVYKNGDPNRGSSLQLGLFTNTAASMLETTGLASITEPAGGTGYARITLTDATWNVATDGSGQVSYPEQTFTATGTWSAPIYGYFIATTGTTPKLLHFEVDNNYPTGLQLYNGDTYGVDLSNILD